MKCPACETELRMTERQGVEIDYCPTCRGVWLDRGELDKLIERSSRQHRSHDDEDDFDDDDDRSRKSRRDLQKTPSLNEAQHPTKKRESFWSELFDFG